MGQYQEFLVAKDKMARQSVMLVRQLEFVNTRQEAMETAHNNSGLLGRIYWFFSPSAYWKLVDAIQLILMRKCQENRQAAARKSDDAKKKVQIHRIGR